MFTGSNEESGMGDLDGFKKEQPMPDISLIPDSGFPIFRGEKGIMRFYARSRRPFDMIVDFSGGEAFNIILGQVRAVIEDGGFSDSLLSDDGRQRTGDRYRAQQNESETLFFLCGRSRRELPRDIDVRQ